MDDASRMVEAYRERTVPDAAMRAALLRRLRARRSAPMRRWATTVVIALAAAATLLLAWGWVGRPSERAVQRVHPHEAVHDLTPDDDRSHVGMTPAEPPKRGTVPAAANDSQASGQSMPVPRPSSRVVRAQPSAVSKPPAAALLDEARRLARAQAALRDGDPRRARVLLDGLARDFPQDAMTLEREALHAIASCELGTPDAARVDAVLANPQAASYAPRIRRACDR